MKKLMTSLFLASALVISSCGGGNKGTDINGNPGGNGKVTPQETPQDLEESFQIGDDWGRKLGNLRVLQNEPNQVIRDHVPAVAKIITYYSKGTGFYLGKHAGKHLLATAAHVLANVPTCKIGLLSPRFYFENIVDGLYCKQYILVDKELDFAIVELDVKKKDEFKFYQMNAFSFTNNLNYFKNYPLAAIGYGEVNNPRKKITYDASEDCRILSPDNRFRSVRREAGDQSRSIPSFATGCDISRGDSGSPVINRETGELLGIVWGTTTPKPVSVKSSAYVARLADENSEDIWKYMSYVIPMVEIREAVKKAVRNGRMNRNRRITLMVLFDIRY
ncbi:MAG: trypsin-like peptidase domain-containing protein [Oligoflexia bacterium]|nr:trypsin-like peptidase domain-containing protein [Oligoflexia bacterium]